jgi:hypothetical protein
VIALLPALGSSLAYGCADLLGGLALSTIPARTQETETRP